jgi:hypothetical protein
METDGGSFMSQGKSSRSGSTKAPPRSGAHGPWDQRPPSRPFSLPPGYYELYGLRPPEPAPVQGKRAGLHLTPPIPRGLLEYYGIVPPAAADSASGAGPSENQAEEEPATTSTAIPPAIVQKKEAAAARPSGAHIDTLIGLLDTPDPIGGVGDFAGAVRFLNGLGVSDLLATLEGAADRGYLPLLMEHASTAAAQGASRLLAALHTVELGRLPRAAVSTAQLGEIGARIDKLGPGEQLAIYAHLLVRRGAHVAVTTLMEGALALRESEAAGAVGGLGAGAQGTPAGAGATVTPHPVEPGPWAPPGEQPIPLYIGNEAHAVIARWYRAAHTGDRMRFNNIAIATLLTNLGEMEHQTQPANLTEEELGLEPDITNLTRLHLYEIKPLAAQGQGAAEAALYLGLFKKAGVAMTLGPVGEPGTSGGVPAPGGVYLFWSPEPGVIVYQYRRGRLVPVPTEAPETSSERRWKFELQPLTREQQQAIVTTTIGGAMLLIIMFLLSPVGA